MDDLFYDITSNNVEIVLHKARHIIINEDFRLDKIKNPYSRIYFVKEGNGTLRCEGQKLPFEGNMIYVVPAELEFSFKSTCFEKMFFHISVLNLEKYDIFSQLGKIYTLPLEDGEYEKVYEYLMSKSYYDKVNLKMHLLSVFSRLQDAYALPPAEIKQYSDLVEKILIYIQENISLKLRVCDISKVFFVSESKIRNAFRKEMGITIGKYIDDLVFTKARQLLAIPSIPLSQISARLGFCDQFYFSRQFKEKFGHTPSDFRKLIRK